MGILRDFVRQQKKATNKGEVKKRKRNAKDAVNPTEWLKSNAKLKSTLNQRFSLDNGLKPAWGFL